MRIRDAVLPAGLVAVVAAVALAGADGDDRALAPWGWALILVSSAALLWRRQFPTTVLVVTGAACLAYYPLGFPDTPIALSLVVALYTVARTHGPVPSGLAAAALLVIVTATASTPFPTAAAVAPLLALPVVLGEVIRGRALRTAEAEGQAAQSEERAALSERARRSAEASRESEALRRATEERLRISRELHDALGHQLSLISVQAGAALHTRSADAAFAALQAIRTASGDALHDLREVLGVLREPVRPGLAALPELLARTTAAGLTVHSALEAPDPAPPPMVQHAAYRIIQEALTNVVRHATAATGADVAVHLAEDGHALVVAVRNDGDPITAVTAGGGIHGMTERASALGGTLVAGPRPGGGFRVEARLPVTAVAAPDEGVAEPAVDGLSYQTESGAR